MKYGYMCDTDFIFELGVEMGGKIDTYPRIYPSLKELYARRKCVKPNTNDPIYCRPIKVRIERIDDEI